MSRAWTLTGTYSRSIAATASRSPTTRADCKASTSTAKPSESFPPETESNSPHRTRMNISPIANSGPLSKSTPKAIYKSALTPGARWISTSETSTPRLRLHRHQPQRSGHHGRPRAGSRGQRAADEQLVNSRLAYVAVSRGRYDAQIYTNDAGSSAMSSATRCPNIPPSAVTKA